MNVKAVGERKCFTLGKVGLDAFFIKLSLLFVVDKNHNNVSLSRRFGRGHNGKTLRLCLSPALRSLVKTYDNVNARILKV